MTIRKGSKFKFIDGVDELGCETQSNIEVITTFDFRGQRYVVFYEVVFREFGAVTGAIRISAYKLFKQRVRPEGLKGEGHI